MVASHHTEMQGCLTINVLPKWCIDARGILIFTPCLHAGDDDLADGHEAVLRLRNVMASGRTHLLLVELSVAVV